MKRKVLRAIELVGLFTLFAFVAAAILFPVFAKPDKRPVGIVLDGASKPMPGAVLRFRDSTGRVVASFTADAQGEFRSRRLYDLRQSPVDGFALTRDVHNTGGSNHYYFSPLGTQTFLIRDTRGQPIGDLNIMLQPTGPYRFLNSDEEPTGVSDQSGVVQFNNLPLGARYELYCRGNWYAISSVPSFADAHTVRTDVAVAPSATIAGRLTAPDGKPLVYYNVFAYSGSSAQGSGGASANQRGRFRITGLRPGTYQITVTSSGSGAAGSEDTFGRRFTIASGQTIDVSLQYRPGRGAETARLN